MQKNHFYYWKNSKTPQVPSSDDGATSIVSDATYLRARTICLSTARLGCATTIPTFIFSSLLPSCKLRPTHRRTPLSLVSWLSTNCWHKDKTNGIKLYKLNWKPSCTNHTSHLNNSSYYHHAVPKVAVCSFLPRFLLKNFTVGACSRIKYDQSSRIFQDEEETSRVLCPLARRTKAKHVAEKGRML